MGLDRGFAASQPVGGGHSEALGEDPGKSGGVGVPDGGGDEFKRVAFAQHGLSDAETPIGEVVEGRNADDLAKVRGEACARHAGVLSELFERPGGFRMLVHDLDGLAEARVAEAEQDSAIDQAHVHGGSEEEHEDVFEETIECGLAAREVGGGLGEEKLERWREFGQGVEGDDEWLGEGRGEGVQHAGTKLDRCADELGPLLL